MVVGAVVAAAAVGLVAGALTPAVAYRLSVEADKPNRDSCRSCGTPLPAGVAGWLRLPSRCAGCRTRLGPPAWLTSVVAAVACALIAASVGLVPGLPIFVAMCVLGVLLGFIDLACQRLPHALVMPATGITAVLFTVVAAVTGQWGSLLRAGLGAATLGAVFLLLFLVPGQGLGYGDVKLAVLLGVFLGWLGWREVLLGALLPWLINGPVVVALLIARKVGRKSHLPFGPAMLVGALLAVSASAAVKMAGGP